MDEAGLEMCGGPREKDCNFFRALLSRVRPRIMLSRVRPRILLPRGASSAAKRRSLGPSPSGAAKRRCHSGRTCRTGVKYNYTSPWIFPAPPLPLYFTQHACCTPRVSKHSTKVTGIPFRVCQKGYVLEVFTTGFQQVAFRGCPPPLMGGWVVAFPDGSRIAEILQELPTRRFFPPSPCNFSRKRCHGAGADFCLVRIETPSMGCLGLISIKLSITLRINELIHGSIT